MDTLSANLENTDDLVPSLQVSVQEKSLLLLLIFLFINWQLINWLSPFLFCAMCPHVAGRRTHQ